ncbi:MAG TPA: hypothetical protein ENK73_07380 [Thiomicrospira sp.]|jgi:hypothetical protein|nr:hypothetical protein [Thiomicrospira sp.]
MSKKESIAYLRAAKSSVVQWRSHVQGYALGMPVDQRHLPLVHTDSFYGRWYYSEGQQLSSLPSYDAINDYLEDVHHKYMELHKLLQTPIKKAGLFGSQDKLDQERKEQVKVLMDSTFVSAKMLVDATIQLEHELMELSDEEFDKLI